MAAFLIRHKRSINGCKRAGFPLPSGVGRFSGGPDTFAMPPSPNSNLVEIQGLTKSYGAFAAVKDLNLSVAHGEIFALLGPNGAGKTTTIRMLMGILAPTAGSAKIDNLDCFLDRVEAKRRVGYLPDEPIFHEYLRGSEIIRFSGLRRTAGPVLAVLGSAALFALVHPPISVVPVFGLGIAAAISFQQSGFLLAPILTHAVYNACVIFLNKV